MTIDNDLRSIQQARDLVKASSEAQKIFAEFSQNEVDRVIRLMAESAYQASKRLAKLAVSETGFGKVEDKILKNQFGSMDVYNAIKGMKTVGIIDYDEKKKIYQIAEPFGVVAAIIPSTNPTSTAMYKTLISVKSRNGVVHSPHPKAANCVYETVEVMRIASERAGAPKGLIGAMTDPTLEGTTELMRHKLTGVILATGGPGVVKAAYSAGKPAYGVGPGNVPAFIERTANIRKAVADIIMGTTFDHGVLCSSEQAIVVDAPIYDSVVDELKTNHVHICNSEEIKLLENTMFNRSAINVDIVGKPAPVIAEIAGFKVPSATTVLVAELDNVGRDWPLSREKLSPVLALYSSNGWEEGCKRCIEILKFGGIGHTLAIHSRDKDIIMEFGLKKPAFRIVVNTLASIGAVGYTTSLFPSMTLGPGAMGGSITGDNITPMHLMNIKRLAFETNPINSEEGVRLINRGTERNRGFETSRPSKTRPEHFTNSSQRMKQVINSRDKKMLNPSDDNSLSDENIDRIINNFNRQLDRQKR